MFFSRTESTWSLHGIQSFEASLLEEVLEILDELESHPNFLNRLYPAPTENHENLNSDWKNYVVNDLREHFRSEREIFRQDIAPLQSMDIKDSESDFDDFEDENPEDFDLKEYLARELEHEDDEEDLDQDDLEDDEDDHDDAIDPEQDDRHPTGVKLEIPIIHAEAWHSVLNQVRLALEEKFSLTKPLTQELVDESQDSHFLAGRVRGMIQSHFYSYLQSVILENLMEP